MGSGASVTNATTSSGTFLCANSLSGQPTVISTTFGEGAETHRSVSTFVNAVDKTNGSLPRSQMSLILDGSVKKTYSLPRERLCVTKSLLDNHTAVESANKLCQEIDHLLLDNMI